MKKALNLDKELLRDKETYRIVIITVSLLSIFLFRNFIFRNNLFLYLDANDDTYQSFLPIYQFVVNRIKNQEFSCFAMNSGLGTNILAKQLAIFDPFSIFIYIIGLIFGARRIAYALVYVHIIKILCAGISCNWFLSYTSIRREFRVVCSILYAFSSYTVCDIGQHYFFATALVYIACGYALVLWYIKSDLETEKRKIYFFICVYVATLCIWSVYFAYMILFACGLFFIYKLIVEKRNVKEKLKKLGFLLIIIVHGIIISFFVSIPSCILILTSTDRVNSGQSITGKIIDSFHFFSGHEYITIVLQSISSQLFGNINNWSENRSAFDSEHLFLCIMLPILIVNIGFNIIRKKYDKNISGKMLMCMGTLIFCLATHFCGFWMNAFSMYSARYLYVLMPIMIYMVGIYLELMLDNGLDWAEKIVNCCTAVILIVLSLQYYNKNNRTAEISEICVCVALILLVLIFFVINSNKRICIFAISIVLILYNLINGQIALELERNIVHKDWYESNGINIDVNQAVSITNATGSAFWRFERSFLDWGIQPATTYADIEGYRGVNYYDSLMTPRINIFKTQLLGCESLQPTRSTYGLGEFGIPLNSVTASVLGIKYVISDYIVNDNNWREMGQCGERYLYRNNNIDFAGLLYDSYLNKSDVDKLSLFEKQLIISNTLVIDGVSEGFVSKCNRAELYNNLDFYEVDLESKQGGSKGKEFQITLTDSMNSGKSAWLNIKINSEQSGTVKSQYDTGFGYYDYYWGNRTNKYEAGIKELSIQVPIGSVGIRLVFENEVNILSANTAILSEVNFLSKDVYFFNDKMSGDLIGHIKCEENMILLIPIIMDGKWKAIDNGKEIEIKEADYCFMAIELPKGEHDLKLEYGIPGMAVWRAFTIMGVLVLIVYYRCKKINDYKGRE